MPHAQLCQGLKLLPVVAAQVLSADDHSIS